MGEAKLLSFLVFAGLRLVVQLGIIVFAVIAALRHKLTGLWILVAAAVLTAFHVVANIVISSPFQIVAHDNVMGYLNALGYVYYAIMFIALGGWCCLALSGRKAGVTDA